jgi:serine/threonine-protein kinase
VHEARDERTGRRVAVKVLLDELAHDPTCVERFRREARASVALHHPCLVEVLDVSLESRPAYLVMELLEGPSLADLVSEQERLPWRRALARTRDVLEALAVLHARGIVHRDVKPANVLVEGRGEAERAKLIDLGVAQLTTGAVYRRLTSSGVIVGTPAFMSPEQLAGERVGPASDLWSVGVLLHVLLTGERPFLASDLGELVRAVATAEPAPLARIAPDVPERVDALVRALLRKRADERPPSAAHAVQALDVLLAAPALAPPAHTPGALAGESLGGFSDRVARPEAVSREAALTRPALDATTREADVRAEAIAASSSMAVAATAQPVVAPPPREVTPREVTPRGAGTPSRAVIVGAAALVAVGALAVTCAGGLGLGALAYRGATLGSPAAPAPTLPALPGAPSPMTLGPARLDVITDAPTPAGFADAIRACIPLEGRRLGPVLHYVVWVGPGGGLDRVDARQDGLTSAERACVEGVLRSTPLRTAGGPNPIFNLSVNALYR